MAQKVRYNRGIISSRKTTSSSSTMIMALLVLFTFLVLILLSLGILSIPSARSSSPIAHDLSNIARHTAHMYGSEEKKDDDDDEGERWVEVISWEPRAYIYHNFLTNEECDYLIKLAEPHMEKSTVVDSETGKSKDSR